MVKLKNRFQPMRAHAMPKRVPKVETERLRDVAATKGETKSNLNKITNKTRKI